MSALARLFPLVSTLVLALLLACGSGAQTETLRSGRTDSNPATTEHQAEYATTEATSRDNMQQTSPATDREALIALYNATDGESWERNDKWLSSEPVGEWHGVLAGEEVRVIWLEL